MTPYTVSRSDDEEAWLAARRTVVTASEAQHVLQRGRFAKTWQELADEKNDLSYRLEDNHHMAAGRFWEGPTLRYLGNVLGCYVVETDTLLVRPEISMGATPDAFLSPHTDTSRAVAVLLPWLTAVAPDGRVLDGDYASGFVQGFLEKHGTVTCEAKNQRSKSRSKWNKPEAPPHYECQAQHQRIVFGCSGAILFAKVDANELYVHLLEGDVFDDEEHIELCQDFAEKHLRSGEG